MELMFKIKRVNSVTQNLVQNGQAGEHGVLVVSLVEVMASVRDTGIARG